MTLTAALMPTVEADAKVGDATSPAHSVDSFHRWAVTGNEGAEEVRLYRWEDATTSWEPAGIITPAVPTPGFGHSVAIGPATSRDEPVIAVGAPASNTVILYRIDSGVIYEQATISAPIGALGFGDSVDTDDAVVIVGAPDTDSGRGAAFLFDADGVSLGGLPNPVPLPAEFGTAVQIEADIAYVGAPLDADSLGAVYVFDVATTTNTSVIYPDNALGAPQYGTLLSADPARVLIGGAGHNSALLQTGAVQTEIFSPSAAPITDVALDGNLIALDTGGAGSGPIHILSDNGSTNVWSSLVDLNSADNQTAQEIVLNGGHLLSGGPTGSLIDPDAAFDATAIDDGAADKITPAIGWELSNFGDRIDIDGDVMVSIRGDIDEWGEIVISEHDGSAWATTQLIDFPIDAPVGGGVAIDGDVIAATLGSSGVSGAPTVAIYERGVLGTFDFVTSFATQTGTPPRSLAIDETGEYLALGLPNPGQVELHSGGPAGWGTAPQVIVANDSAGTGSTTFGHDVDFGDGFLLIGKPGTSDLLSPAAVAGGAEQWRVEGGAATFFGDLVPGNSAPGDAAGWAVEIDGRNRAVASPSLRTVQVWRSGQSDGLLSDPSPLGTSNWGSYLDLDDGILAVGDWTSTIAAYDLHQDTMPVAGTYQPTDLEAGDGELATFPLATSGGTVMFGSRLEDWQGRDAGAVYTFSVLTSPPGPTPATWLPVVDIDAGYAVVGNPAEDLVHVLRHDGADWTEHQQLVGVANTSFGAGVAIEGDRLAVGSPDADGGVGEVQIFSRGADGSYAPANTLVFTGATSADDYGAHLDLVGDWLIAGAPVASGVGAAVIFNHRTEVEAAVLGTGIADDGYGSAVAISNVGTVTDRRDIAWVGAPTSGVGGQVIGYGFDGTVWSESATIAGPAGAAYGSAIDANGERVAANAPTPGGPGFVQVSTWDSTTRIAGTGTINPTNGTIGGAVAHSGDMLAVGAPGTGVVHVWSDNGDDLTFAETMVLSSPASGRSLALDGQWLIGATDSADTDWTQLVHLTDLSVAAPHPNTPPGKLTPLLATDEHRWGTTVAASADTIVVAGEGSWYGSANSELVVVDRATDTVVQRLRDDVVGLEAEYLAVDLDGDRLAIATAGTVAILERSGPGQAFATTMISIPTNGVGDVDLDGDTLVFGLPQNNQIHIYEFDGTSWAASPSSPLTSTLAQAGHELGTSVAISGNVIFAGAPNDSGAPANGYVARWSRAGASSAFSELATLSGTEAVAGQHDAFGTSLDFDGTHLVVGAPRQQRPAGDGSEPGLVYVYDHVDGGALTNTTSLLPTLAGGDDSQAGHGTSVAVDSGLVVIGSPGWTGTADQQGAVSAWNYGVGASWTEIGFTVGDGVAADAEPGDALGTSVALGGSGFMVAGAPGEDASGADAGAAYTFEAVAVPPPPEEPDNKLLSEPGVDLTDGEVGDLFGYAIDSDGTTLVIGVPESASHPEPIGNVGIGGTGGVFVYTRGVDGWIYDQFITNPDTSANAIDSQFGAAVAVAGDTLVVGAPGTGSNSTGTAWLISLSSAAPPQELLAPGVSGSARYGWSVAMDDPAMIAIGAPQLDFDAQGNPVPASNYGGAFLWQPVGGVYQVAFSTGGDAAQVQVGRSVDITADGVFAVGTLNNPGVGYVDVFRPDGAGGWTPDDRISADTASTQFGAAVDLDAEGDQLVVGAPNANEAFVYAYDGSTWDAGHPLVAPASQVLDNYAYDVAIDGTVIAIGNRAEAGAVHVWTNTAWGVWNEAEVFFASDGADLDSLGFAVDVIGGEILAGAPFDDNSNGTDGGAVYRFAVTEPPPPLPPDLNKIIAEVGSDPTDGEAGDLFGHAVDSDGQRLVIGAPEISNGQTGGVHVYERVGDTWQFERYFENPNVDINSSFGIAVAVDGDLLVVGSPFADTAAGANSGTAWLFDLTTGVATELPAPVGRTNHFYGIDVDVEGGVLAIGARGTADDGTGSTIPAAGELHVFESDGAGTWNPVIVRPGIGAGVQYSAAVAVSGGRVASGSADTASAGYVEVFNNAGGTWELEETFTGTASDAQFGFGLDLDGNHLAVGSPGIGNVTMFTYRGDAWDGGIALASIGTADNKTPIDIEGTKVVIGDPFDDTDVDDGGRILVYEHSAFGEWTELLTISNPDPAANDFFGTSVTFGAGDVITGAERDDNTNGTDAGAVYRFEVTAPAEPQPENKLISEPGSDPAHGETGDHLGTSMATDGDRLVIGAPELAGPTGLPRGAGGVFVYQRMGDSWSYEARIANPRSGDLTSQFGWRVDVAGDLVAIGAPETSGAVGTTWVVDLSDGSAVEIPAPDPEAGSWFGFDVAVDGSTLAVGSITQGLRVYEFDGTDWNLTFEHNTPAVDDQYARSVDLDDDRLVVGSSVSGGLGFVEIYERTGAGWALDARLLDDRIDANFGVAVDLDGDNLIVGASTASRATIFHHDGTSWDAGVPITDPSLDGTGFFGFSVALDGTLAVVGESHDTDGHPRQGRVHVFGNTAYGEWTKLTDFAAPDPSDTDLLGISVAVTGDMVFGGALLDDNSNGVDAGAAYYWTVTPPPPPPPPVDPATIVVDYTLPATVTPGATTVTVEGAEVGAIGDAAATSGIVAASIGSIDFADPELADNSLGDITLGQLGLDSLSLDALRQIPLTEFPIDGGWAPILAGTQWAGLPLQTVTLADVYHLQTVQDTPLRFTDIEASPLRFTDIAAIGFGELELLDIDIPGADGADTYTKWCDAIAGQGTSCTDLGIGPGSTVTLGGVAAAGVDIEATPLRFTPLRFTSVEASPLRFTPLRFTDIEASPLRFTPLRFTPLRFTDVNASPLRFTPLRFTPLRFTPLRFTPLRFTPLRFTDVVESPLRFTPLGATPLRFTDRPDSVADCNLIDCDTATIADALEAGALRDFTLDDLGDAVLQDLRFDDIVSYLGEASVTALIAILADDSITIGTLVDEFGGDLDAAIGDLALGDIDGEAFDIVTELLEYTIGEFLEPLPPEVLDDYTIADFLLLFLPRSAYEWDAIDLSQVTLQAAGMQAPLTAAVSFVTTDGPATNDVRLTIDLPANAIVAPNSAAIASGSGYVSSAVDHGTRLVVTVAEVAPDVPHQLVFGLLQGLSLGTSSSTVTATVDTSTALDADSISVVEAFEPENDSLAGSVPIVGDNLYISHVGTAGDLDYFRVTVTSPATTVSVRLGNLAADLDMVVYGPKLDSIIPADDHAAASAPETDFAAGGGGLSPVPLNDLPTGLDQLQVYGASYHRGTDSEQVDFVALEPGDYFIQVSGYLGASTPEPYTLRAAVVPTSTLPCPPRTFAFTGAAPGTNTSVSPGANTVILINRSRLAALYGPTESDDVVTAAEALVAAVNADGADGVSASILDVDALPGATAAYTAWDSSPCSTIAVNNVVKVIADSVLAVRGTQKIDHLLIVGGDDVIPFARVADATTIANEVSYTNTFTSATNHALRAAFEGSWLLTDDPYADRAPTPIANTDRVVYVPELAMGRLVETPSEIVGSIDNFIAFDGQLDPQTGFVAGYDFLDDGAEATGDHLDELISPGSVQRLINESWTAADLEAGLATGPDAALVSAHFDHANALPAAGNASGSTSDLFDVTNASALDFSGSVLFSVGCHGGLSVSDVLLAPTGLDGTDWAQTFLKQGAAAYVANTGYGYGDDTAVALSEALLADFAAGLSTYETVGEALLYAKQDYAADLTVYGTFDEKALMEATFYGIPFYRLGNTVIPEPVPDPPTGPAPTGGVAHTASLDPILEVTGVGTEDEVWSTPDDDGEPRVQVTNGYPILPRFEWEVTQQTPTNPGVLEIEARGVVLESLVTRDEIDVDPATARAVYDLAANEPNTDSTDVTFALAPAINTYLSPEGIRQQVSMTVGAFEASAADGSGTMRLFEQFEATVYYAVDPAGDSNPPVITEVQSNSSGGTLNLSVTIDDESAIVRTLALVTPSPIPNQPTTWQLVELSQTEGSHWQGDVAVVGDSVQWLIMAVDANGNSAWSMSKDLAFDGTTDADHAPILLNPNSPVAPIPAGESVSMSIDVIDYDGSSDAISATWDFGDGSTCTAGSGGDCGLVAPTDAQPRGSTTAAHSWGDPGEYEVTVTATDSAGNTTSRVIGIVVVVPAGVDGTVIANGRVRRYTPAPDDIVPARLERLGLTIHVRAGHRRGSSQVRLWAAGFRFTGTGYDQVRVIENTATVTGSGLVTLTRRSRTPVDYQMILDESTGQVVLTLWASGADTSSDPPLYRLTTALTNRRAIRVTP